MHVGLHDAPDARLAGQSPLPPLLGAALASQGFGLHVAAASVPVVQLDWPDTVYPALHVGLHDAPDARLAGQSPFAPLVGAALASQGFGLHELLLNAFLLLFSVGAPMYPVTHVHAPSAGPPAPVLYIGHGTGAQLPLLCFR